MRGRKKGFLKTLDSGNDIFSLDNLMHLDPNSRNYTFPFWDYILGKDFITYFRQYSSALACIVGKESEKLEKMEKFLGFLLENTSDLECISVFLDFCGKTGHSVRLDLLEKLLEISKLDFRVYSRLIGLNFGILEKELKKVFQILNKDGLDFEKSSEIRDSRDYRIELAVKVVDNFANARKLHEFFTQYFENNQSFSDIITNQEVLEVLALYISKASSSISCQILNVCIGILNQIWELQDLGKISHITTIVLLIARHSRVSEVSKKSVLESCVAFHSKSLLSCLQKKKLSGFDANILAVWHGLLEAFYFYSEEYLTSNLVLKLITLNKDVTDFDLQDTVVIWQTKIALLFLDHVASTVQDPFKVKDLNLIVSKLSLLKNLKLVQNKEHVLSVLCHLTLICRLGSPDQIKAIVKYILKLIRSNDPISDTFLRSAVFFEITQIHDCFLDLWFHQMNKELKRLSAGNDAASEIKKLFNQAQKDDLSQFVNGANLFFEKKIGDQACFFQNNPQLDGLLEMLTCLKRFPIHYFSYLGEKKIVSALMLMDKVGCMIKDMETRILWLSHTRSLLAAHIKRCQHHIFFSDSSQYLIYLLDTVDNADFTGYLEQEECINWDTITIIQHIFGKLCLPKFQSHLYNSILDYRNNQTLKTWYWDYALFSTLYKLLSKKSGNEEALALVKVDELSVRVFDETFSGGFDSRIQMMVVDEILKVLEKAGLSDIMNLCCEKLLLFYHACQHKCPSWLNSYELLCNWFKYIPQDIHLQLLESGWKNVETQSVRSGIDRMIQLAKHDQSLVIAENAISTIGGIIKGLNSTKKEIVPAESVIRSLKIFFEADTMTGGGKMILKQLAELLHSLLIVCALTPNIKSIIAILDFCDCLIGNKNFILSSLQICKIMEIISVIGESDIRPSLQEEKSELFQHIYLVANDIVRYQRESLVSVIPQFISILQDLLTVFQEKLVSYPYRVQEEAPSRCRFGILTQGPLPLPSKLSSLYSNIIMSMTQKPSREVSDETLLTSKTSRYIKPFSKHAPFLIIEFINIQSSKQPFQPDCKKNLMNGMYSLLNLCSKHGHDFVLATLDPHSSARPLFKKLFSEWETDHKFNGV